MSVNDIELKLCVCVHNEVLHESRHIMLSLIVCDNYLQLINVDKTSLRNLYSVNARK